MLVGSGDDGFLPNVPDCSIPGRPTAPMPQPSSDPQFRVHQAVLDSPLLGPDDPPVYEILEPLQPSPVLLLCDHANHAIPRVLGDLGVPRETVERLHIGWDIGAAAVTRLLAKRLHATALFTNYSRLLIDINRHPGDPTSILAESDGVAVPANRDLPDHEAEQRLETFFWPYHHAITQSLATLMRHGPPPAVVSIHSFTEVFQGLRRPWELGFLWNHDPRLVAPLFRWFEHQHPQLTIGDNQPYSGREVGFTLEHHAGAAGLPNVCIEIRQDLIGDQAGQQHWADIVGEALEAVLSNASLHKVEHY